MRRPAGDVANRVNPPGRTLQLDDVVALERIAPGREPVHIFGVVTQIRARHEGARFDSDVFRIEEGVLPAEVTEAAHILATRFEARDLHSAAAGSGPCAAVEAERGKDALHGSRRAHVQVHFTGSST